MGLDKAKDVGRNQDHEKWSNCAARQLSGQPWSNDGLGARQDAHQTTERQVRSRDTGNSPITTNARKTLTRGLDTDSADEGRYATWRRARIAVATTGCGETTAAVAQ